MKNLITILISVLTINLSIGGNNPENNKSLKLAETFYSNAEYYKALKYYKKAIKQTKFPTESYENMATSYLKTGNAKMAHKYFLKAEKRKNAHREIEVVHAFALKRIGKYKNAKALLKHYLKVTKDSSVVPYIDDCTKALKWRKPNPKVKVAKINGLNGFYSDMAPYYYNGKIIFASAREEVLILEKSSATGQPYYRLYSANIDGTKASEVEHYHYHEKRNHNITSLTFGNDQNEVFYSTNQKIKKDTSKNISPLKIYESKMVDGKWQEGEIIIGTENDHINYAHPFYDKNSETLFFTSNKDGGHGGMDIYYCKRNGDGWSEPTNAGTTINTDGDETFPSFYGDNLYFSSDRRAGLGGYDIFSSRLLNGTFQTAENMKAPINTNYDDFGFTFTDSTNTLGYFTSNRKGAKDDDIFAFKVAPKNTKIVHLSGIAINSVTGEHIKNATISLTDDENTDLGSIETDDDGHFDLELVGGKTYTIKGDKNGYFNVSESIKTDNKQTEYEADLVFERKGDVNIIATIIDDNTSEPLSGTSITFSSNSFDDINGKTSKNGKFESEVKNQKIDNNITFTAKIEKDGYISSSINIDEKASEKGEIVIDAKLHKLEAGIDIGKLVGVSTIYYELGESGVSEEAAKELNKVIQTMKDNPTIVIELGSHTDSRGDDDFNMNLSQERARKSVEYMIKNGIPKSKITYKGYGETQLVNDCGNDADCSEEEHTQNRRTEFKILKF